jgi:hypothetical protein
MSERGCAQFTRNTRNIKKWRSRSRSGASTAQSCEACDAVGDLWLGLSHADRIINDHEKKLIMSLLGKMYPVVIVTAVSIALLLRFMMYEFDNNGLSYLAVVSGFGAVGVLQLSGFYMSEKIREMPQPWDYW